MVKVDEMVRWLHRLNGHELGPTLGDSEIVLQSMGSKGIRHDLVTEYNKNKRLKGGI